MQKALPKRGLSDSLDLNDVKIQTNGTSGHAHDGPSEMVRVLEAKANGV
jgi:hypothetical protein